MHPKTDILLKWHRDSIEFYFNHGFDFYLNLIDSADETMNLPNLSNRDLAVGSFRFFKNSIFYELNAMVEEYFLYAASKTESFLETNSNLKKNRSECIRLIYEKYKIDIQNLPGNSEIMELYSIVNGLKHRGGMDFSDFSR